MQRRTPAWAASAAVLDAPALPYLAQAANTRVVRFGQSASLTGGQAVHGKDVQNGIAAALGAASAQEARHRRAL
jgi:hypothetical protein